MVPRWVDQFEQHDVHQSLTSLQTTLTSIEEVDEEPSPEVTEETERLKQVIIRIEKTLDTLDPFLIPISILNNLNASIQQSLAQLNQYESNANISHLQGANNQIDGALVHLSQLVPIQDEASLESLTEGISSFRRSIGQYNRHVNDESKSIKSDIGAATQSLEQLTENIASQQSRLDDVVSEFQRQFSESEERRRSEFAETEKNQETRFREFQEELGDKSNSFFDEQSTIANERLEEITAHKERAQQLIHVIANTGMVGGYQKIANDERRAAFRWQVIAVGAFVGLISFAIFAFGATLGDSVSWQIFGARTLVAVAFGVLAAYGARQADKHEHVERSNRRLELALASVDPYLVSLPENLQHEVKQELAMRFFGETGELDQQSQESDGSTGDTQRATLIQTVADLVSKLPGGAP